MCTYCENFQEIRERTSWNIFGRSYYSSLLRGVDLSPWQYFTTHFSQISGKVLPFASLPVFAILSFWQQRHVWVWSTGEMIPTKQTPNYSGKNISHSQSFTQKKGHMDQRGIERGPSAWQLGDKQPEPRHGSRKMLVHAQCHADFLVTDEALLISCSCGAHTPDEHMHKKHGDVLNPLWFIYYNERTKLSRDLTWVTVVVSLASRIKSQRS